MVPQAFIDRFGFMRLSSSRVSGLEHEDRVPMPPASAERQWAAARWAPWAGRTPAVPARPERLAFAGNHCGARRTANAALGHPRLPRRPLWDHRGECTLTGVMARKGNPTGLLA